MTTSSAVVLVASVSRLRVARRTMQGVILLILVGVLAIALFLLGRWILRRIGDYPATLFGPLEPPPRSS